MTLVDALLHAAIAAAATVLPVSASGHRFIARMGLGEDPALPGLLVVVALGSAIAMAAVVRGRLYPAVRTLRQVASAPRRAWSQPAGQDAVAVLVAAATSTAVALLIAAPIAPALDSPIAVGLGLLLTALSLATVVVAPAPQYLCPTLWGSAWIGLAHGLGIAPGLSQVGAAFVVASWLCIRGWRAVELALMITVATSLVDAARGLVALGPAELASLPAVLALLTAVVVAAFAALCWRWLSERRATVWWVAWLLPLSLATLGYARAAPAPWRRAPEAPTEALLQNAPAGASAMTCPWRTQPPTG